MERHRGRRGLQKLGKRPWSDGKIVFEQEEGQEKAA